MLSHLIGRNFLNLTLHLPKVIFRGRAKHAANRIEIAIVVLFFGHFCHHAHGPIVELGYVFEDGDALSVLGDGQVGRMPRFGAHNRRIGHCLNRGRLLLQLAAD